MSRLGGGIMCRIYRYKDGSGYIRLCYKTGTRGEREYMTVEELKDYYDSWCWHQQWKAHEWIASHPDYTKRGVARPAPDAEGTP